jgi:hypothetical protein
LQALNPFEVLVKYNADFRSNLSCLNDTQLSGQAREAPVPWRCDYVNSHLRLSHFFHFGQPLESW